MLATPSRRCPPDCLRKTVLKKLKPVSHRIKELAQPPRQRLLMTLKSGAHILPPALLDNLVKTLEDETCLTPEQASTLSRKKKFGKKKREKKGQWRYKETSKLKKPSLLGTVSGTGSFDKDSVSCQYLMAERFVKSILQWKCPITKSELNDVSEVIVRRLVDILEYTLPQDEDRKSQQIRFLADLIACWVTGVLSEVAQDQEKKLTERCKRKEDEMKAEEEEDDDDDDDDDDDEDRDRDRDRDDDEDADAEWREKERLEEEEDEEEEEEEEDKARDLERDMEGEREDEADQLQEAIGVDTDDEEMEKTDDAEEIATEIDEEADLTVKDDDVEATETEADADADAKAEAEVEAEAKTAEAETDTQVDLEGVKVEAETETKTAEAETDTQVDLKVETVEAETEVVGPEEEPAKSEMVAQVETEMEPEQEGEAEGGKVVKAEIDQASIEPTAEETEGVRGDEQRRMEDDSKVEVQPVEEEGIEGPLEKDAEEEKVVQEKKEPDGAKEMEEKGEEAAKVPSDREKAMAMDRSVTKDLEELFKSDLPFLTFGKIIDTVYNMVEDAPENTGEDPITNGIHRVIYEKLSSIVVLENPELLTEELKDIMDVVCGKIANWLRSVLSKSQIAFMERYVPMVESKEIRDWTRWLTDISDAAIDWNTWLRGVIEKIFEMESAQITRGEWQDWTKSVDTGALLWRRFHLQTIHQAHRNVTMMLGRRVVKTGTIGTNSATSEQLIHATDLHA